MTTSVDIPVEQRQPGESSVRGALINAPFVPINEGKLPIPLPIASVIDSIQYAFNYIANIDTIDLIRPVNKPETVFLDADPVTSSGISTMSSPMSCDSWMNYSSNSSDDLSCISDRIHAQQQHQDSSEESSLEFDTSVSTAQSTPKIKRNFNLSNESKCAIRHV